MIYCAEEGAFLDVCIVHFVECYSICPTNAQYTMYVNSYLFPIALLRVAMNIHHPQGVSILSIL